MVVGERTRSLLSGTTFALALVATSAVLLSGCSSISAIGSAPKEAIEDANPAKAGTLLNEQMMGEEFLFAAENFPLPLPAGIEFPTQAPANEDPTAYSEPSVGEGIAVFYWRCAWEAEYLAASDADADAQSAAIERLSQFESLEWSKAHVVDPGRDWHKNVIAAALAGDPSGVEQDFGTGSCTLYRDAN